MQGSTVAISSLAFLGFGEAAQAFLDGWRSHLGFAAKVAAYDIKADTADPDVRTVKLADYAAAHVSGAKTALEAVAGAEAVFSLVTADQAHEAALAALPGLGNGALVFDCNSCAPQTKVLTAGKVEAAGGRFVDVAVMAAVHPHLHRTPLLISGLHSEAARTALVALDMDAKIQEGPLGSASAVKMIRSIMMKGGGPRLRMRARRPQGRRVRDRARFAR